jgi:hypothetical protein
MSACPQSESVLAGHVADMPLRGTGHAARAGNSAAAAHHIPSTRQQTSTDPNRDAFRDAHPSLSVVTKNVTKNRRVDGGKTRGEGRFFTRGAAPVLVGRGLRRARIVLVRRVPRIAAIVTAQRGTLLSPTCCGWNGGLVRVWKLAPTGRERTCAGRGDNYDTGPSSCAGLLDRKVPCLLLADKCGELVQRRREHFAVLGATSALRQVVGGIVKQPLRFA